MAKNPCKYIIEIKPGEFKEMTEPELKDYLLTQDLSNLKSIQDAIQERSAEEKISRPRGAGENIPKSSEGVRSSQQRQKIAPKSRIEGYEEEKVNEFLYKGTPAERQRSLLKNLMSSDIPEEYKKGLEEQGLTYKVSNQVEANQAARAIVNDLGVADALDIARSEKVDPSVGSAIFAESLNDMWSKERKLRAEGKIEEADALARQWTATSKEYANLTTGKGQWNAQIAYFYKTSPMGFSIMVNEDRYQNFETSFYNPREANFKDVFKELLKGEEGQALIKEEVEKLRKEERVIERAAKKEKVHKAIDDWADKWIDKLTPKGTKGVQKQGIGVPEIIKTAASAAKTAYDAGVAIEKILQDAVKYVSEKLETENWDKDAFKKELSDKLKTSGIKAEKTETQLLQERIKSLENQISDYNKLIEQGGGKKNKTAEQKFKDNEEVAKLIKERDALRKENDKLVRAKNASTPNEEAIKKRIEKLEEELDRVTFRKEKEAPPKGSPREKQFTDKEKELINAIEVENKKWDAEVDATRKAANDYKKLETERNRQLKRVEELNEKLNILLGGNLPETKKLEPKKDTPEIESIKEQIVVAEKAVRENIAYEKNIKKLEEELDRVKNRKSREKNNETKKEISEEESLLRKQIESERLAWNIENNIVKLNEELQRIKDRKEKEPSVNKKRELTDQEKAINDEIKAEKERWAKELEPAKKEADEIKRKQERIKELNRRVDEIDFTAEAYKAKKEKTELDKELDKAKEAYNEARKTSAEYIDKKAKQYLEAFSKRLKGLSDEQKETIVRRSLKKIVESGGLEYDEFKDIIAEASGVKKLTEAEIKEIEALTAKSNIADDLEQEFLNNPTRESIDAFKKAKAESLEADRKLYELTTQKADVVGTLKSLITLNYLSLNTLVKNFAQNIIYQSTVRFPASLSVKGVDYTVYQVSNLANKIIGTKVIKPKVSLTDAQKGYFKEYKEGAIRGWEQMIKGIDEKDYFSQSQYASTLNPRKAYRDLKKSMSGELFLSKQQKIDKWIQSTLGWQPYAISRGMIYGDKMPRYAAQGAEALQLGHQELGIKDPIEIEAFMTSPEKYAYNYLIKKAGLTSEEASKQSKSIAKRIVDAGSKATFQNENYLNDFLSKIDEWARVTEKDNAVGKIIKPPVAILKASTLPFVKTPANVAWVYFKVVNPELTMLKSMGEAAIAKRALSKGDLIGYREYSKKSKESFGFAVVGLVITAGAAALVQKGLVRTKNTEEDEARERAGESFFGKDNQVNLGVLLGSGDDYWVDLSWFGPIGSMIDVRGRMMEDAKQKELKGEPVEASWLQDRLTTLGYSTTSILNTLVFDQGAKLVDALRKGPDMAGQLIVNNANALENMVFGGTLASMSRALTPEKVNNKADNVIDEIKNNTKQRNIFVAWATGYPPSKISIWGEPMPQDKSVSGVLGSMLGFEKGSNNKFGAILYDEQRRTGRNEFFPPVEDYRIKVNGKDVKISEAEKRDLDVFIGQARKVMVAPFIYNKSTYPKIQDGQLKEKTFLDLTNDKDDESKLAALAIIYKNAKEAGFAKFKDKYKQYQDASINIEQIKKEALEGAEKEVFKARFKTEPK